MTANPARAATILQLEKYRHAKAEESEWKPPIPLDSFETPNIPSKLLPDCMAEFVNAVSLFTQTPPELSIAMALATVSASARGKFRIFIRGSYSEPVNEYFISALPPGQLKTPVFNACLAPVNEWETNIAKSMELEVRKAKRRAAVEESKMKELQTKAGKASEYEKAALLAEIDQMEENKTEVPVIPYVYTDDVTSEGFIEDLSEQGGCLSVFSDEGGLFETMAGRYSGGIPNLDVYLKGHSGSTIKNKRKGKAAIRVDRPAIAMGLTVQPDVIAGLGAKPGFMGRGLMARFKYFLPMSLIGTRKPDPPEIPEHLICEWHKMIHSILNTPAPRESFYMMNLDADAHNVRRDLYEMAEAGVKPGGEYEGLEEWANKMTGSAIRLAGIMHIAHHSEDEPWEIPITGEEMTRAADMILLLAKHAAVAFGTMGDTPEIMCARDILEWIKEQKQLFVKKRDIQQKFKGTYRTLAQLDPGLNLLMERDYIRDLDPDKTRGKTFEVNPKI